MLPPVENAIAAFPPARRAGRAVLRALTLGGAVRLGAEGVDCGKAVPRDKLVRAAFVLSGEEDFGRFAGRLKCGLAELSAAVEGVLNDAFSTWIRPAAEKGGVVHLTPHGLGWPLELAEWLCAEYGWGWREAIDTPVATVWALAAACRQRNGGAHAGLDYIERRYREDVKAGRVKGVKVFDTGKEEAV
jgi:hypothetical protein